MEGDMNIIYPPTCREVGHIKFCELIIQNESKYFENVSL